MPASVLAIVFALSSASQAATSTTSAGSEAPEVSQAEVQLWPEDLVHATEVLDLRLLLVRRGNAAPPFHTRGVWSELAAAAPVQLAPGLLLKIGMVTGQVRFVAPPLSSAQLRMSAFRAAPRGGITLMF